MKSTKKHYQVHSHSRHYQYQWFVHERAERCNSLHSMLWCDDGVKSNFILTIMLPLSISYPREIHHTTYFIKIIFHWTLHVYMLWLWPANLHAALLWRCHDHHVCCLSDRGCSWAHECMKQTDCLPFHTSNCHLYWIKYNRSWKSCCLMLNMKVTTKTKLQLK